jgi:hypothetical protein
VVVDSRYDLPRFRGATAATPNEPEVEALAGVELGDERALEKAGRVVLERLDSRYLLITRGSRGMALLERLGYKAPPYATAHSVEQALEQRMPRVPVAPHGQSPAGSRNFDDASQRCCGQAFVLVQFNSQPVRHPPNELPARCACLFGEETTAQDSDFASMAPETSFSGTFEIFLP